MILSTLAALSALSAPPNAAPVALARTFKKGERLTYRVDSNLAVQRRFRGLQTWMPEDLDLSYGFTTEVTAMKTDGIAQIRYKRPTFTVIEGETHNAPPKRKVEKVNYDMLITVSPLNEIIDMKDLGKKKSARETRPLLRSLSRGGQSAVLRGPLAGFISDIYRLALFVGSFDSALDFSPKLSLDEVKVGDTWKRTAGYQPQKVKGKHAVQRLDYTYTYKGRMKSGKTTVERIQATLALDANLADFVHEAYDVKPQETGLKGIPVNLKATIDFDLDPKTKRTLRATARAKGGFQVVITELPDEPIEEQTFEGTTILKLVSTAAAKPPRKKRN